jgi:GNAT superfamily N-acetyltransferase
MRAMPQPRSPAIRIRPAAPADAVSIGMLMRELGYEIGDDEAARRHAAVVATGYDEVSLLVEGTEALGMIALHHGPALYSPLPIMTITVLVVHSRVRRRGAGRLLIEHAIRRAKERGCGLLRLTTAAARADAHAFYRAVGFESTSIVFHRTID